MGRRRRLRERLRRWILGGLLFPPAFACGGGSGGAAHPPGDGGHQDPDQLIEGVPPPVVHAPPETLEVQLLGPELDAPRDVFDLAFDGGGGLWLAAEGGLFVRPPGQVFFRGVTAADGVPRAKVISVGGLGPGTAVVGYNGAPPTIVRLNANGETASVQAIPLSDLTSRIRTVETPEGRFAILATGSGLAVMSENGILRGPRALPLPSLELWDASPTANGDVWLGDAARLARIAGPFTHGVEGPITPILDLVPGKDDDVVAIESCPDETLWVSTLGAGIVHLAPEGTVIERLTKADVLPQDHVPALACDLDGTLWIGTSWGGLVRRDPDGRVHYHGTTSGLPGDSIRRLVIVPDEAGGRTLWIATEAGAASYSGG